MGPWQNPDLDVSASPYACAMPPRATLSAVPAERAAHAQQRIRALTTKGNLAPADRLNLAR